MSGRFITFEGGEGTGKSRHAELLAQRLRTLGVGVVLTREPGGSPGAEIIRHVLLSGAAKPLGADAEAILFAAARNDHVRSTIQPALALGRWVICDRFIDSTIAYQGFGRNIELTLIESVNHAATAGIDPDLTFFLDLPLELAKLRRKDSANDCRY